MRLLWPALAILLSGIARGQAPSYSAAGIVNAANSAPGPFAANSVLSLYGANLSMNKTPAAATETPGGKLPTQLNNVSVLVANMPAPLLYVSDTQINFLIPIELTTGPVTVRVVRQSVQGPDIPVNLATAAPALFTTPGNYARAVDWNANLGLITPDSPAHPGDVVIVYATGLGALAPGAGTQPVPAAANSILALAKLQVTIGGVVLDPKQILYAGVTPGFAGLYQLNLVLPDKLPADPEIIVSIGDQSNPAGLKLAVR